MNEMTTTRTAEIVAAEIRALTATMLANVIEIGRRFCEAKSMIPHGEFGAWVEENTGYSQRTANNFMRLFDAYGDAQQSVFGAQTNSKTFANLPYSKALALLSVPENEREGFAEEVRANEISLRELQERIREREQALADAETALGEAQDDIAALNRKLNMADIEKQRTKNLLEEMKNRPTEVAVREPTAAELDEIVADRLKESEALHAKALEGADAERRKLAAELAQARQDAKAAKDKLKQAKADRDRAVETAKTQAAQDAKAAKAQAEEAARLAEQRATELQGKVEALEKQLAMADSAVTAFRLCFTEWQRLHGELEKHLANAPEAAREKLRTAMEKQMEAWRAET